MLMRWGHFNIPMPRRFPHYCHFVNDVIIFLCFSCEFCAKSEFCDDEEAEAGAGLQCQGRQTQVGRPGKNSESPFAIVRVLKNL